VKVSFLPDRERLALVVRDIQASRRALPLIEIANRFLGREDLYLVKLELPAAAEGAARQTFVQCLECKRVFRTRANAEAHLLNDHLDKFFAIEETEVEPPAGQFRLLARCGLSGVLLGPPNHHGYNEKIQELWSSRFAHLSKAEYLGHVETLRDEALVEQWKDSLRKKTIYRLKDVPEGQEAAAMTRAEAQDWMRAGKLNALLRESGRCLVPGPQSRKFDDGALRAAVSRQPGSGNPVPVLAVAGAAAGVPAHAPASVQGQRAGNLRAAVPPAPGTWPPRRPSSRRSWRFWKRIRRDAPAGARGAGAGANPESPRRRNCCCISTTCCQRRGDRIFQCDAGAPARRGTAGRRQAGSEGAAAAADVALTEAEARSKPRNGKRPRQRRRRKRPRPRRKKRRRGRSAGTRRAGGEGAPAE
jgi:hypothetical protein